jgi:uncharacterized protein
MVGADFLRHRTAISQFFCNNTALMSNQVAHHASMLLAFRAENVRSFRDAIDFSMVATSRSEPRVVREISWQESGRSIKVVPVAGVFGANASGKSNFLEAFDDMRMYVLNSFRRDLRPGERWPFRLDTEAERRPSRYEIDLVLNGVRHEYGFAFDGEQILEEWAFRYPRGRPALLFDRKGEKIEAGPAERSHTRAVTKLLRPNALFLSAAAAANHPLLLPLHDWFRRNLQTAASDNRPGRQAYTIELLKHEDKRERILGMLRAADFGIVDAKEHELPVDPLVKEGMERAIREMLGEEGRADDVEADLPFKLNAVGFTLVHQGAEDPVELPLVHESMGTQVWLGLIGTVVAALADGVVLLADELDASLHPDLVAQLVRLFQDPRTNPNRAQLIFNSHDPTMLGDSNEDRLLGRDQIWFTAKQADGSSRLYPLTDFNPRKNEALERRYLDGRYGAVPILSRQDFDLAVEVPAPLE